MAKALFKSVTIDDVDPNSELRGNDTREIVATQASSIRTLVNAKEAIAEQQTNLEAKFDDNIASLEEDMLVKADKDTVESLYTLRIQGTTKDGHKMIAGWGLGLEGGKSRAIFDVDQFAIGASNANAVYAFVVDNGRVIMDEALIRKVTFTKLVDGSGNTIITGSKIKAKYIDVDNLDVKYSLLVGSKPPTNADHTGSNTAADTSKVAGTSATTVENNASKGKDAHTLTGKWKYGNTTEIDGGSIRAKTLTVYSADIQNSAVTSAKIEDAAVTNAKIKNAAVETLTIKDHAVTATKIARKTGNKEFWDSEQTILTLNLGSLSAVQSASALISFSYAVTGGYQGPSPSFRFRVFSNNTVLRTAKVPSATSGGLTMIVNVPSPSGKKIHLKARQSHDGQSNPIVENALILTIVTFR